MKNNAFLALLALILGNAWVMEVRSVLPECVEPSAAGATGASCLVPDDKFLCIVPVLYDMLELGRIPGVVHAQLENVSCKDLKKIEAYLEVPFGEGLSSLINNELDLRKKIDDAKTIIGNLVELASFGDIAKDDFILLTDAELDDFSNDVLKLARAEINTDPTQSLQVRLIDIELGLRQKVTDVLSGLRSIAKTDDLNGPVSEKLRQVNDVILRAAQRIAINPTDGVESMLKRELELRAERTAGDNGNRQAVGTQAS